MAPTTAYLFVDTDAFETLAAQPENKVRQRDAVITGYETYLVEQWALERAANCVICSYTGDSAHTTEVQAVLVPEDAEQWSPATRRVFEELVASALLPKETPLGNMLITALASFPADLTLVPLPPRYRTGRACFVVNENLKRLAVVGRVAVAASSPNEAALATFRRTFCVAKAVDGVYAVLELVTLVQLALFYFGVLEPHAVDGFLCNGTAHAITAWWRTFGALRFAGRAPRPESKLYMRTSCCALLGAITGARQRLRALGLKPPKDPFDVDAFTLAVRKFQKMARLPRTAQLDAPTYEKLVQETAHLGGQNMLTAMKSTVKESLSGKAAGGVDDWETLDLERFAQSCRGHRAKYLFQGAGQPDVPHITSASVSAHALNALGVPLVSLAARHETKLKPDLVAPLPAPTAPAHVRQASDLSLAFSSPERAHFHFTDDDTDAASVASVRHDDAAARNDAAALLTKDDSCVPRPPRPLLRRTASLGAVERAVFGWHALAPVPEIVALYEDVQALQARLRAKLDVEAPLLAHLEHELATRGVQAARVQAERDAARMHLRTAEKRRERVLRQAHDLEAAMERIDYEVAALNLKIKDVDQAVTTFAAKVDALDAKCAKAREIRPDAWYTKLRAVFR